MPRLEGERNDGVKETMDYLMYIDSRSLRGAPVDGRDESWLLSLDYSVFI